jgi:prepilin-type N-terminal cleavage/methylation domain-containing protein
MTKKAFTFIEILMVLTILGLTIFPLMRMFSVSLAQVQTTLENITALNLARMEMEKVRNLNFTVAQLQLQGNSRYSIHLNKIYWIVERLINNTDPLEVIIKVFRQEEPDKPKMALVTLIEDLE